MSFEEKKYEFEIEGKKCSFSTGKFALKSHSAVFAQMGDTVVLATVNIGKANPEMGYFPLSVEYMEKMYAAGLISSSRFVKRDKFPSDDAILRARIIDRSIRPRFPHEYIDEVSVIVKVLSYDPENDPVILGVNAVSAALMISDAPFDGPVAGVRVGLREGALFPYYKHIVKESVESSDMNFVLAGDDKGFTNIDADLHEIEQEKVVEAMNFGSKLMQDWLKAQQEFTKLVNYQKNEYEAFPIPEGLVNELKDKYYEKLCKVDFTKEGFLDEIYSVYEGDYSKNDLREAYEEVLKMVVKHLAFEKNKRFDGRDLDEIRKIGIETGVLPRVHGSGLFTRGLTQVLTIATLGTLKKQKTVEDMLGEELRNYMHYYIETPFVFGEAGRVKYIPGRREVGHGSLAEKALYPVLPNTDEFPYTMLLMSEIQSENGSSSMASTCASSLALMDAGVPIKRPVAGIGIGVIVDNPDDVKDFRLLIDMRGEEDFYGYMDFKVTGTSDGFTAIQMDTKAKSLPIFVFEEALKKGRKALDTILEMMEKEVPECKKEVSQYAPKVATVKIPPEKIGELIGPGGKNIRMLSETTKTEMEVEDDGKVNIFSVDRESLEEAEKMVSMYALVPEVGEVYEGVVDGVVDFGAFVEIAPGISGLVHVSELSDDYVKDVNDFAKVGEKVKVKIMDIDKKTGKMKFTMKGV
jgi:polyribonucleotide nucleotidyltransferase